MVNTRSPKRINPESELVLLIAREVACDKRIGGIKDLINLQALDWGKFKNLITYHELFPFAYLSLKDCHSLLPQDLIEFLKSNYYFSLMRSLYLSREFLRVLNSFEQARITLLPIKGIALLMDIYPQRLSRPMVDIDILVKEEELLRAEGLFYDLGYRKELYGLKEKYWRERQCHIVFYKKEPDGFSPPIELHWALDFRRKNSQILPGIWNRVRRIQIDGREIKLLSPEDTFFSLALHGRRFGKTLCLKNACDGALVLSKYGRTFDWDYLLRESRRGKMCSSIFFFLSQIKFLLNVDMPKHVWRSLDIPAWKRKLIRQFIKRNIFLATSNFSPKNLYLKSHFLLYDSLWEPIDYILNIPKEQFSKYYSLKPYEKKTDFLYKNRLFYIPFKTILNLISRFLS